MPPIFPCILFRAGPGQCQGSSRELISTLQDLTTGLQAPVSREGLILSFVSCSVLNVHLALRKDKNILETWWQSSTFNIIEDCKILILNTGTAGKA